MTHGDDLGLVLPPKIAPIKVYIVPIGKLEEDSPVMVATKNIENSLLSEKITFKTDLSDKTPGFKFAEAEVKGYPIRIEIGPRDLENGEVTLVRRDTLEKIKVKVEDACASVKELLEEIQKDMYNRALERRNTMLHFANTWDEMKSISETKPGFIKVNWCKDAACEDRVKDELGLKSRCIPLEDNEPTGKCTICGKDAKCQVYFGKQY